MKRMHSRTESILRSLIREYRVSYTLPGGPQFQSTLPKPGSATKVIGAFILGLAALQGYIFIRDNKDAILSFAENIKNLPETLSDLKDLTDLVTNESRKRRRILEGESTFKTDYGDITTVDLDRVIIKNLYDAESKSYITLPGTITSKNQTELKALLDPIVSPVRSKVSNLTTIVTTTNKNFPSNFSSFGTFEDVDAIADLDDTEKIAANNAITDGVATAIYNSIKTQMQKFIQKVSDSLDKKLSSDEIDENAHRDMKSELEKFAVEIAAAMELAGKAKTILAGS